MSIGSEVSDSTFEQDVLGNGRVVLVHFWSPFVGTCRTVDHILSEIQPDYIDKLEIVQLNKDENPQTIAKYGVRSLPTLMIFKDGAKLDMLVGTVSKSNVTNFVEKYI